MINKKLIALIIAVILLVAGVVAIVSLKKESDGSGQPGISSETDKDDTQGDKPNGEGLDVKDETDDSVIVVDVSGDWGEDTDDSNDKTQTDKEDKEDSDSQDDKNEGKQPDEDKVDEDKSDKDILTDDKVWGEPS